MILKKPSRVMQSLSLTCLLIFLSACSVSGIGHNVSAGLPSETRPPATVPEVAPEDTVEPEIGVPILVTEPVPLVPESASDKNEPTIEVPPQPVEIVQPNPNLPPLLVIEEQPSIQEPLVNIDSEAEGVSEISPILGQAPPVLIEAIEDLKMPPSSNRQSGPSEVSPDTETPEDPSNKEIVDVVVTGSCYEKSKVALVWYHYKNKKNKRSRVLKCESNQFRTIIRGPRKHFQEIDLLTLRY